MPHLSINALGPPTVTLDGQSIIGSAYAKAWALLVYLAYAPDHAHRRETLAGLLWPDQTDEQARTNLRQALARLRQALDDANATPPYLFADRTGIQFNAAGNATVDVAKFTALLTACTVHAHRDADICAACAERREQAVALYRGAFLEGFHIDDSDLFEHWAALERDSLHQQATAALASLVAYYEHLGDYAQALRYGERQLQLDPWREEAYRQIMRLLALNGQRSAALHRYDRCRAVLQEELGVAPSAETVALYEQIRAADTEMPTNVEYLSPSTQRTHHLPLQPTPFVGRVRELAALADRIHDPQCRLITLVGPGGIGKTRLALQALRNEADAFADGVAYVSLAPLRTGEFVVPTVAAALQIAPAGHATSMTELLYHLRRRELLLLLDNFEHLLAPASASSNATLPDAQRRGDATALLTQILEYAPGVKLLVTSRERLNIQREWVFDVGGLEIPPASRIGVDVPAESIEASSAVALFLQTARRVLPGFNPTPADRTAIVHICRLTAGMPLALELAAAWVRVLSCHEIAQEIANSIDFLATNLRDLPERHRSLQAVFDHSWQLLTPEEQRVFAACSVFRGGFARKAAAEVAQASLARLAALVDKSLLRRNVSGRYEIHELSQQYGAAQLARTKQMTQVHDRHLAFYARFAEEAEPKIRSGRQVVLWHAWVEGEHDNLRAALDWSWRSGNIEPGLRIVGALWEFWMNRGHAPEGQMHAERFLAHRQTADYPYLQAKALHTAGVCAYYHGRYRAALAWLTEAVAIGRELGADGDYVRAMALIALGYTRISLREYAPAHATSREALRLGQEAQEAWIVGDAWYQLAILAQQQGDNARAHECFLNSLDCFRTDENWVAYGYVCQGFASMLSEQGNYAAAQTYLSASLAIHEEMDDLTRVCFALTRLGRLSIAQGDDDEAGRVFARALGLIRTTGHLPAHIEPLNGLGWLAQRRGDYARARAFHEEALALCTAIEEPAQLALTLEAFAWLAARQEQAGLAVHLFGAADAHALSAEARLDPAWRHEHEHLLAHARSQLGEDAFAELWAAGAAMTRDQAVALAQSTRGTVVAPISPETNDTFYPK